ncbi:unnamed protein product [Vitrella brassicaformis CCMP3155]|uniref:Chromo domain-containing protein n=1 Tax=Vitrella brassicaformis (strain CCMP3155) TaxID=1169540 RepID=A0A0G4GNC7_VITBC|nr:unnamed protein product [Vitrella brassicaformis CCMP3155]|eukprot:CEM31695.1 unnamed protein product [Vitrella brassicaformis CCMP3155]
MSRPSGVQENAEHMPTTSDEEAYQLGAVESELVDANIDAIELRSMAASPLFYLNKIKKAQDQCAEVSCVKAYLKAQESKAANEELDQLRNAIPRAYWPKLDSVCLHNGLVSIVSKHQEHGPVLLVPTSLRKEALVLHHEHVCGGHLAVERAYKRMAQQYYWPGMYMDLRKHTEACQKCQGIRNLLASKRASIQTASAEWPFQKVAMDFIGPLPTSLSGKSFALTVQDTFTKWPEVFTFSKAPGTGPTGEDVVGALMDVISRHGHINEIVTDNGSHFVSDVMREVMARLRIKHTTTSPMHPQADGLIERYNRTLKDWMRPYLNKEQSNWDDAISLVLSAYRTTEHESTGFTPFKMLYGREAVHPSSTARLVARNAEPIDIEEAVKLIQEGLRVVHEIASETMSKKKKQAAEREKDLPAPRQFKEGDRVRIYNDQVHKGLSRKLASPWRTVGIVQEKKGPVTYKVRVCGDQKARTINVDRLKRAPPPGDGKLIEVTEGDLKRDRRQTVFNQDAFLSPEQERTLKDFALKENRVRTARTQRSSEATFDPMAHDPSLRHVQPDQRFERGERHEVEQVIGKRTHHGKVQYKLKWRWYPLSHATWEDEENLTCTELVQEYENSEDVPDLDEHASLFPASYSVVRVRHVKELNREHTVKVTRLEKEGIQLQYLKGTDAHKETKEGESRGTEAGHSFG